MKKQLPLWTIIVPVLIVAALAAVFLVLTPATAPGSLGPVGERVSSNTGGDEALDFATALAEGRYAHAAQYVQEGCTEDCMFEGLSSHEIAAELQAACETHVCATSILDILDEDPDPLRTHQMRVVDEQGNPRRFCIDLNCGVQKSTYILRVRNIDGMWYVQDLPPVSDGFPQ